MSGKTITRYVLTCDGCHKERGTNGEYESAMDARAAAYGEGWRFPPRRKKNGVASAYNCDVCADCLPTFNPESVPLPDTWKNRRGPE